MSRAARALLAAWLLAVAPPSAAQTPIARGWKVTPDVALRIWLPAGQVELEAWDRDSIDVSGTAARGSSFFGGVGTDGRGGKLGVESVKREDPTLPSGTLRVRMPRRARVAIKMTEGRVTAVGTTGSLEVLTVTGEVTVRQASGSVTVETIDATVRISATQGAVRVRNGGGVVTLADVEGSMTLTTVGGSITVEGPRVGDGRLETIGGSIIVRGALSPHARLDVQSHDGPITLALDRLALPRLDLATRGGILRNGLGLGDARFGEIVGRSFKGGINVLARSGIEGGKVTQNP